MPVRLKADWEGAKMLFCAGLSIPDISAKLAIPYNALRQRARRNKWSELATKEDRKLRKTVADVTVCDVQAVLSRQLAWKKRVLNVAEKHLATIEAKDCGGLELADLETLVRIADKTDLLGRRQLGLDSENQHSTLNVHIGRSASTAPKQLVSPANEAEIIDVSSEAIEGM